MAVMTPVATMPATAVPMAVMPAAVPVAVVVAVPAHFFRLDAIDIVLRDDSGLGASGHRRGLQFSRHRRKRRGLCSCSKRGPARHKAHRYL